MDTAELSMPIIGLQCTLLAVFLVVAFSWVWFAVLLACIGTVFTIVWAVMQDDADEE